MICVRCPIAIAPPLTFVFSGSSPNCFSTARYTDANGSFTSITSISFNGIPVCLHSILIAGTGPMPDQNILIILIKHFKVTD